MTKRLEEIFSALKPCDTFADIGCDHGYISKAMSKSGKCKRIIISDVSEKCLEKARALLSDELLNGKAISVVSDGFDNVPECDQALIAGMGGEEIVSILDRATSLPQTLVLQPMKNVDKVRLRAVKVGYRIEKDYCFTDGKKYYDLIVLEKGTDVLTDDEIEFGRTNLTQRPTAFLARNAQTVKKLTALLSDGKIVGAEKAELEKKLKRLKEYV